MNITKIKIHAEYVEECLGTNASDPAVHEAYIASLAPDAQTREEEVAAVGVEEVTERGMTIFPRTEDGKLMMWDYMVKGFLKAAAKALAKAPSSMWFPNEANKARKAFLKIICDTVHVKPRKIIYQLPEGTAVGNLQRPLLGNGPQGPRVALANSESVPVGTQFDFTIELFDPRLREAVMELLWYGEYVGLGQWRNSGKGRFKYTVIE